MIIQVIDPVKNHVNLRRARVVRTKPAVVPGVRTVQRHEPRKQLATSLGLLKRLTVGDVECLGPAGGIVVVVRYLFPPPLVDIVDIVPSE